MGKGGKPEIVKRTELLYATASVLFVVACWIFSSVNKGFHMHDEVGHYLAMKGLWHQPWDMLSIWQKPGYKFLFFPFSKLGEDFLIVLHAACIAAAAWLTGKTVVLAGFPRWRFMAMAFTAFQPIVWQTAFRFNSENFAALLLAAAFYFWYRRKWVPSALLISYAMVSRFELGLVAVVFAAGFLAQKHWRALLALALFPLIINLAGWIHFGDPVYFLSMLAGGSGYNYAPFGFFYNWKMLSPAIGVLISGLVLAGLLPLGKSLPELRAHWKMHFPVIAAFLVVFLGYCLFTSDWFPWLRLQTQDRAFVQFAPATAILATLGFAHLSDQQRPRASWAVGLTGIFALLIAVFNRGRYVHPNRFAYADPGSGNEVLHAPVAGAADVSMLTPVLEPAYILLAVCLVIVSALLIRTRIRPQYAASALVILTVLHTLSSEKPIELSAEDQLCKEVAGWVSANGLDTATVLCSHNVYHYFAGNTITETGTAQRLRWQNALRAPAGAVLLWDNRYAYQPTRAGFRNTPLDSITGHPEWFRPLTNGHFQAAKGNFGIIPFVKTVGPLPVPAELQD